MLFRKSWNRLVCISLLAFSIQMDFTEQSCLGEDMFVVRSEIYPPYIRNAAPDSQNAKQDQKVPFIYHPGCLPGQHTFYACKELISTAGEFSWCHPEHGAPFRIGTTCQAVKEGNTWKKKWILWMTWQHCALRQPLDFQYSDDSGGPAHFDPVNGSSFGGFWSNLPANIRSRLKDVDAARDEMWSQYVDVGPRTFTDSLRENFGWQGGHVGLEPTPAQTATVVDLRPGMRLRIEWAAFQEDTGETLTGDQLMLRGFVGQGTSYLHVTSQRPFSGQGLQLSMDPFLGHLAQQSLVPKGEGNPNLASGAPDFGLSANGALGTNYRLVYPSTWFGGFTQSSSSPAPKEPPADEKPPASQEQGPTGSLRSSMKNHVLIVASAHRAGLSGPKLFELLARDDLRWTPNWSDPDSGGNYQRAVKAFRGRTYAVPEIQITVQGEARYVSVGTRLSQLLDVSSSIEDRATRRSVRLSRYSAGRLVPVCFSDVDDLSLYEIPLAKGDHVRW